MKHHCLLLALAIATFCPLTAQQPMVSLELVAGGFTFPVDIANAGDDRLFVVQRRGQIFIIDHAENVLPDPFLNIDPIVHNGGGNSEQGLLGLAFHPDYKNNGYFYVNYNGNDDDTRISRFTVDSLNPNKADPNSEKVLMTVNQPFSNHNGGDLAFDTAGYLYIGLGDGGSGNDPQNNGQNGFTLLGSMLRIDVDNGNPYAIPDDNPFLDDATIKNEAWAIGLRNPWRFSFDRLTHDLWIADVGQNVWEEINFQPADSEGGENYGWRCYEGNHAYITGGCLPIDSMTFPVHEYAHNDFGCSITGGFVYRGSSNPDIYGYYLYADFCTGFFGALIQDSMGAWQNHLALDAPFNPTTFGEDVYGEMYVAGLNQGSIYRVRSSTCASLDVDLQIGHACEGGKRGQVMLAATGGTGLYAFAYEPSDIDPNSLEPGKYAVVVTDSLGCQVRKGFTIEENPPPPVPVIEQRGDTLFAPPDYAFYQWFLEGVPVMGADNDFLVVGGAGQYTVEVYDENGCSTVSDAVIVGIPSIESLESISVHPNPGNDFTILEVQFKNHVEGNIRLLNAWGQEVLRKTFSGSFIIDRFDMSLFPAGVYFFRLDVENGIVVKQFIKQ